MYTFGKEISLLNLFRLIIIIVCLNLPSVFASSDMNCISFSNITTLITKKLIANVKIITNDGASDNITIKFNNHIKVKYSNQYGALILENKNSAINHINDIPKIEMNISRSIALKLGAAGGNWVINGLVFHNSKIILTGSTEMDIVKVSGNHLEIDVSDYANLCINSVTLFSAKIVSKKCANVKILAGNISSNLTNEILGFGNITYLCHTNEVNNIVKGSGEVINSNNFYIENMLNIMQLILKLMPTILPEHKPQGPNSGSG